MIRSQYIVLAFPCGIRGQPPTHRAELCESLYVNLIEGKFRIYSCTFRKLMDVELYTSSVHGIN